MKISEHEISLENGTEYFNITFKVSNETDLTFQQYKEIECFIYAKLKEIKVKQEIQKL